VYKQQIINKKMEIDSATISYGLFALIPLIVHYVQSRKHHVQFEEKKIYHGSCHCKAVKFVCTAPKHLVVWNCNCSICFMKKNWHFIIPQSSFELLSGAEALTEYRFNTKKAKHVFCKHCGVQAYYTPRSNPDGIAVTLACVNQDEVI
jgi:hypothetical protein